MHCEEKSCREAVFCLWINLLSSDDNRVFFWKNYIEIKEVIMKQQEKKER